MADRVEIYPDGRALSIVAAQLFLKLANRAIAEHGAFSVALAGGATPRSIYSLLADPSFPQSSGYEIDWKRVQLYWGDERCVPPDHPDSNYHMVFETLLSKTPIPLVNVHRMRGELGPVTASEEYEQILHAAFGSQLRFDLIMLGIGEDGHTASLFPETPAVQVADRWVVGVEHRQPPEPLIDRVSLTLPAINSAYNIAFIVSGAKKAAILRRVLQPGSSRDKLLPARLVQPSHGNLLWLLDEEAARGLTTP